MHFVSLVNVVDLRKNGLGSLGAEQIEWLEDDLKGKSASTPIDLFAHLPLWMIAPESGRGTEDSAQVLAYLKRFGSVTVLNGHIHQLMQKVEGNVTFHTARSTAFPQPAPDRALAGTESRSGGRIAQVARRPRGRLYRDADRTRGHQFGSGLMRLAMKIPMVLLAASLAAGPARAGGLAGDPARGKQLYEARTDCHSLDKNDVGPRHRGVFGRKAGSFPDYSYSEALKSSNIVWNEETLDRWLTDPQALVPGARMYFRLDNAQDRADVIAYLKERAK